MEQRAQLTQNEVQWYKYLNYTARAYLHGWQVVTSPIKAEAIYLKPPRYIYTGCRVLFLIGVREGAGSSKQKYISVYR